MLSSSRLYSTVVAIAADDYTMAHIHLRYTVQLQLCQIRVLFVVRTSTLRVGDAVVAINGVELDDKNVDEVTRLLAETDQRPVAVLTVCRTVAAAAATSHTGKLKTCDV